MISDQLGVAFLEYKVESIKSIFPQSDSSTPLIIFNTSGNDPSKEVFALMSEISKIKLFKATFQENSLDKIAAFLGEGALDGRWCLLTDCHRVPELKDRLEELIDRIYACANSNFRIFLTSNISCAAFSASLIKKAVTITYEISDNY